MTERFNCRHEALPDEDGNYTNGSYALWEEYDREWNVGTYYGTLCYECFADYGARKCLLGGVEIEEKE